MSPSARARKLAAAHPDWSLSRIGERCGLSRQGVAKALKATGPVGRPRGIAGKKGGRALVTPSTGAPAKPRKHRRK